MEEAAKLVSEMCPAVNEVLGLNFLKSNAISTDLPSDILGFWLTQGVPLAIFILHVIIAILDERDIGRCFVSSSGDRDLTESQEKYITEFCLDQATHTICSSSGDLVCSESKCDMYDTLFATRIPSISTHAVDYLFVYRYHIWFLFLFIIIRALPQIVWRLLLKATIRRGVNQVATVAEFKHAIRGKKALDEAAAKRHDNDAKEDSINPTADLLRYLNKIALDEVEQLAKQRQLFVFYILRKIAAISLDIGLLCSICYWNSHHTGSLQKFTFICDLQSDGNNAGICKTVHEQYIPCVASFGVEFVLAVLVLFIVLCLDLVVQTLSFILTTKCGHFILKRVFRCCCNSTADDRPLFYDNFLFAELKLEESPYINEYKALMKYPNDLYLIGLLYRQSDVRHGHFLKMMAERMIERTRFDYCGRTLPHAIYGNSHDNERRGDVPVSGDSPMDISLPQSSVSDPISSDFISSASLI